MLKEMADNLTDVRIDFFAQNEYNILDINCIF